MQSIMITDLHTVLLTQGNYVLLYLFEYCLVYDISHLLQLHTGIKHFAEYIFVATFALPVPYFSCKKKDTVCSN